MQEAKVAAASRFQMVSIFIFLKLSTLKCKIPYNVSIFALLYLVLFSFCIHMLLCFPPSEAKTSIPRSDRLASLDHSNKSHKIH